MGVHKSIRSAIVEDSRQTDETLIFSVKAETKTAICPHCGRSSHRLHQNHGHLVKDLPMANREVILRVNRWQFKCGNCQKPFSKTLIFVARSQIFTNRYAVKITEQLIHSDVNKVAKNNGLTNEEVWSMVMFIAESIMPIHVEQLKRLGIDKISLVKGQGKFIVVLVDLDTHKLIGLV